MKVAVVLEDDNGVHGDVCAHFGQCKYFFIADIDEKNKAIIGSRIVPNNAAHGGGGCQAVAEIMKYNITHLIASGMGMGAQQRFAEAGVKVYGYSGNVGKALEHMLRGGLGGLDACKEHEHGGGCH